MRSALNEEDWQLLGALKRPTWALLRAHSRGTPDVQLSVDVEETSGVCDRPATRECIGAGGILVLAEAVGIRGEEEIAFLAPEIVGVETRSHGGSVVRSCACLPPHSPVLVICQYELFYSRSNVRDVDYLPFVAVHPRPLTVDGIIYSKIIVVKGALIKLARGSKTYIYTDGWLGNLTGIQGPVTVDVVRAIPLLVAVAGATCSHN